MPEYLIYRISDRAVAAWVHPRRTADQEAAAIAAEITNVVASANFGGDAGDYTSLETVLEAGRVPTIAPDLTVTWADHPRKTEKDARINGLKGKLRGMGLTDDEIALVISG